MGGVHLGDIFSKSLEEHGRGPFGKIHSQSFGGTWEESIWEIYPQSHEGTWEGSILRETFSKTLGVFCY